MAALDIKRITALVEPLLEKSPFDLENITVSAAGAKSVVKVIVDGDRGLELDDVASLSREISSAIDSDSQFGSAPFTLEVTSPGVDRPLTQARHWRRARGRMVAITDVDGELRTGRVGATSVDGSSVELVVRQGGARRGDFEVISVVRETIAKAVVQVEFSKPHPEELALSGGVAEGRVAPATDAVIADSVPGEEHCGDDAEYEKRNK